MIRMSGSSGKSPAKNSYIQGDDILSNYPDAELQSMTKGYVHKCDSQSGICFDILETKYAYDGQIRGDFPKRKSRAKYYFTYIVQRFREDPESMTEFRRSEYYLPDGTLIFSNDCFAGHSHCSHMETMKVAELFDQYRSSEFRRKKSVKPKMVRKPKKVVRKIKRK